MMYKVSNSKIQIFFVWLAGFGGGLGFFLVYFFLYNSHISKTALRVNQQY